MLMGTFVSANAENKSNPECTLYKDCIPRMAFLSEETGTLRIETPKGTKTFQFEGEADFPCCGEIVKFDTGTSEGRWSFPVYHAGGSFTMSGDTTNMDLIILVLENIFGINIT